MFPIVKEHGLTSGYGVFVTTKPGFSGEFGVVDEEGV